MHLTGLIALSLAGLGVAAGILGALVGIGGGILVVPVLVLLYKFDIRVAVATSLVTVVATSTTAGSVWVGKGLANMRLGMTLEVATTLGGLSGGLLASLIAPSILSGLFGVMMGITAALMLKGGKKRAQPSPEKTEDSLERSPREKKSGGEVEGHEEPGALAGSFHDRESNGLVHYRVERLWLGGLISLFAGIVSGLLGVGGGFIKVPAMNLGMRVPIQVAVATSNFMVGVTAIASLLVYLGRGMVHPAIAAPVALGTVAGSYAGTRLSQIFTARAVKLMLAALLVLVAIEMLWKAFGAHLGH